MVGDDVASKKAGSKTIIVTAVAKKKNVDVERVKGERMENDADHMEVRAERLAV